MKEFKWNNNEHFTVKILSMMINLRSLDTGKVRKIGGLMKIPKTLTNLTSLRACNNIDADNMGRFVHLTRLEFWYGLRATKISIMNLIGLKELVANAEFDQSLLSSLINLTSLDLTYTSKWANSISILTGLTILKLNNNKHITNDTISRLTNLVSLSLLKDGKIRDEGLYPLINLRSLGLFETRYITSNTISLLTNLTKLTLSRNRVVTGDGIQNCTNLINLNLKKNIRIHDLVKLTGLKKLNLRTNTFITDNSIRCLTNLTALNLYKNKLISNECINKLPSLTRLINTGRPNIISKSLLAIVTTGSHQIQMIVTEQNRIVIRMNRLIILMIIMGLGRMVIRMNPLIIPMIGNNMDILFF